MGLTNEIKDKIVLALTGTTREQCFNRLAEGEKRCAQGVILEGVYGAQLNGYLPNNMWVWDTEAGHQYFADFECASFYRPSELSVAISHANNSGSTFDEIAKLVKDWPTEDVTND